MTTKRCSSTILRVSLGAPSRRGQPLPESTSDAKLRVAMQSTTRHGLLSSTLGEAIWTTSKVQGGSPRSQFPPRSLSPTSANWSLLRKVESFTLCNLHSKAFVKLRSLLAGA